MGYAARFEFSVFNGPNDPRDALIALELVTLSCELLYRANVAILNAYGQDLPRFYDAGLVYATPKSPCGGDVWQDIRTLYANGSGDCKDLACARAADLFVRERILAKPVVRRRWFPDGFALYHIVVQHPNGVIEDPSLLLGMDPSQGA